jgi:FkbM family methyltransferase
MAWARVVSGFRTASRYPYFLWYAATHPGTMKGRGLFKHFHYSRAILRWWEDTKTRDLLHECPLDERSLVFDVGGFTGEWARQITQRYKPSMHIFEPDHLSFTELEKAYAGDPKVKCHPFGLAGKDSTATLHHASMGSTVFSDTSPATLKKQRETSQIQLRDVRAFMKELGDPEIDLIKVNIEGGEYELLDRMIENGLHLKCKRIRVQFHEWIAGSHRMYDRIRAGFARSHDVEWEYPFVWESWVRKDVARPAS